MQHQLGRELHGKAVQAAALHDDLSAIDRHDLTVGESIAYDGVMASSSCGTSYTGSSTASLTIRN